MMHELTTQVCRGGAALRPQDVQLLRQTIAMLAINIYARRLNSWNDGL